jgi:hypothetical protein
LLQTSHPSFGLVCHCRHLDGNYHGNNALIKIVAADETARDAPRTGTLG